MELFVLLTLGALMWISKATGDIRCYCSDAECVNTGYTCHSAIGRCFSQLSYEATDSTRSRHGCAETLPLRDRSMCESEGDIIKTKNGPDEEWPLLMCCKEDMCNYQESLDINIYVDTKANGSIQKGDKSGSRDPVYMNGGSESRGRSGDVLWPENGHNQGISQRDLWFKAAVIAVPIAGGFILILLVLLAVRMLRNDSRRQRHLMHIHHQRSLTKAQLYVADHFYHNETECLKNNAAVQCGGNIYHGNNMAVNGNHPFRECHDVTSCQHMHQQQSNVYKDVSVKLDKKGYEKMRPWSDSSTTSTTHDEGGSVNSVVLWNGSDPPVKPPNRATNV